MRKLHRQLQRNISYMIASIGATVYGRRWQAYEVLSLLESQHRSLHPPWQTKEGMAKITLQGKKTVYPTSSPCGIRKAACVRTTQAKPDHERVARRHRFILAVYNQKRCCLLGWVASTCLPIACVKQGISAFDCSWTTVIGFRSASKLSIDSALVAGMGMLAIPYAAQKGG